MHASRTVLFPTLFGTALSLLGCQHAAPPPKDDAIAPDPAVLEQKVGSMELVGSGTNKGVTYKAKQFGQLYLFDETTGLYVYHGPIAAGETFAFEPASSRAQINKQTIDLMRDTNERDEYKLYFIPG